jgi:hypothetical protein
VKSTAELALALAQGNSQGNPQGKQGLEDLKDSVDVLVAMIGVEDSTADILSKLNDMREDLGLLRQGPFNTAMESLRSARRVGRADPSWCRFLSRAEENFFSAISLVKTTEERSHAEFFYAVTCLLLNDEVNANAYLARSCSSAQEIVDHHRHNCDFKAGAKFAGKLPKFTDLSDMDLASELASTEVKITLLRSRMEEGEITEAQFRSAEAPLRSFAAGIRSLMEEKKKDDKQYERTQVLIGLISVAGKLLGGGDALDERRQSAWRSAELLRTFLPFYNLTQYARAQISADFTPAYLELQISGVNEDTFLLTKAAAPAWR